jgi:hypothetical protein
MNIIDTQVERETGCILLIAICLVFFKEYVQNSGSRPDKEFVIQCLDGNIPLLQIIQCMTRKKKLVLYTTMTVKKKN